MQISAIAARVINAQFGINIDSGAFIKLRDLDSEIEGSTDSDYFFDYNKKDGFHLKSEENKNIIRIKVKSADIYEPTEAVRIAEIYVRTKDEF